MVARWHRGWWCQRRLIIMPKLSLRRPTSLMYVSDRSTQSSGYQTLNWLLLCGENWSSLCQAEAKTCEMRHIKDASPIPSFQLIIFHSVIWYMYHALFCMHTHYILWLDDCLFTCIYFGFLSMLNGVRGCREGGTVVVSRSLQWLGVTSIARNVSYHIILCG